MQPSEHGQHGFGTLAVHAGSPHDPTTGAVIESVSDIVKYKSTYMQTIDRLSSKVE